MVKETVKKVLKKAKRPLDLESIYLKIENIRRREKPSYQMSLEEKEEVKQILKKGIDNHEIYLTPTGNYLLFSKTSFRLGRFHGRRSGDGFVTVTISYEDRNGNHVVKEEKYVISKDNCNGAIDGDFVMIDAGNSKYNPPKVEKIISRHLDNITGEVVRVGNSYFVKPIDKKKQFLQIALEGEAIEGERVSVTLKEKRSDNFYIGEIERVFNHKDDPDEDILWEAFKEGVDANFSKESLEQLKDIPTQVRDIDKIGREDLTDWEIFTIDGADTKDIDDALSCRKLPNGNYEVGVHIADVSNYVVEGSPLDKDAFKRGNSYYLAGRVIPMLPHKLSNGICSLNPDVERLAFSCIMEISPKGNIVNHRLALTVIRSRLKMTYDKVNDLLKSGIIDEEYEEHADTLRMLNKLALVLRKKRIKNGSIEFDRPELKLVFDEEGKVNDFSVRRQDVGENLIEEFMVLANECVDKHLEDLDLPCLHRVHGSPNEERLEEFLRLLEVLNIPYTKYSADELVEDSFALQDLTHHIKNSEFLHNMLSFNMVRCMSRARYSPNNIGHMGLAKNNYCHFTSPIRRYPDLTVHRILKECCIDSVNHKNGRKWQVKLPDIGNQTSKTERIADHLEDETLRMKCSEYMEGHVGEEFVGTIIGISDRGIQVQLDNLVEGRIRIHNLDGDYVYNPTTFTLLSMNDSRNYYIGDRLVVKVLGASKEDKSIDFGVVSKIKENRILDYSNSNQYVKKRFRDS